MNKTIEEAAKEAVRKEYFCENAHGKKIATFAEEKTQLLIAVSVLPIRMRTDSRQEQTMFTDYLFHNV